MTKQLGPIILLSAIISNNGLRTKTKAHRRLSTKYCGEDALSAYLSCNTSTVCTASADCKEGEGCYEINCPVLVQAQDENLMNIFDGIFNSTGNETLSNETSTTSTISADVSDDIVNSTSNETVSNETSTSSTTTTPAPETTTTDATSTKVADAVDTTPPSSDIVDDTTPTPINETETISIITVNASATDEKVTVSPTISLNPTAAPTNPKPTTSPTETVEDWTSFDYAHTKFCGPKVVGGYDIAVSQCGPLTICGVNVVSNHYGASGNDCPKNFMCYSDIICGNGPGPETTTSSSEIATSSNATATTTNAETTTTISEATTAGEEESATNSSATTKSETTTEAPTTEFITTTTTTPYNPILLTTRAAFCGSFYAEAVLNCGTKTMCTSSSHCEDEEECFENVSCTYDPNIVADDDEYEDDEKGEVANSVDLEEATSQDKESNQVDWNEPAGDEGISFAENEDENSESSSTIRKTTTVAIALMSFFFVF